MVCALCSSSDDVAAWVVVPARIPADTVRLCGTCRAREAASAAPDVAATWLRDTVWSEDVGVQVLSWRLLQRLPGASWARELLEQVWLDDEVLAWAQAGLTTETVVTEATLRVVDSNGTPLAEGDAVTLIKDLEVKGAGFTAKRGTLVKNIHLTDDAGLIEGRVNGTVIVLKTAFLKRA